MKFVLSIFAALIVIAAPASATTPKKWYWTQSHAETTVLQRVKIPTCWVWPDNRCDNPPGPFWANGGGRVKPATTDCSGADEYHSSFKFNRFTCKIMVADGNGVPAARGTIALYVTGATTFRWKLLDG
jgi:hypothetical protein